MKKVIAVCGPTAVGKTRMGVSLCRSIVRWILELPK